MNSLLGLVSQHGYLLVFLVTLGESMGLPLPASLAILAAGAAAAAKALSAPTAFAIALVAILMGDTLLFFLGRYTGWMLLSVLCRLSMNPETCILRSAESFYKRGKITLVWAKFIPGINTMAPPLAGSMKMKTWQFWRFDAMGAGLYVLTYGCIGYLSRDVVVKVTERLQTATHVVAEIVLLAIVVYAIYRVLQYRRYKNTDIVPRVPVEEVARRLAHSENKDVLLIDVRSHGYYDPGAARIAGSVRLEPNRFAEEIKTLPRDKDIYIYCT
jgi:membrane protein DedA with SNARE-associated domain